MNILDELTEKVSDILDAPLCADAQYQKAAAALHEFSERELSTDHAAELEGLVNDLTSAVFRIAAQTGMRLGANIMVGLLQDWG